MSTKSTHILLFVFIAGSFLAGIILYPSLPEQMAAHWNVAGEADGYMTKLWGTFLIPLLMVAMYGLYAVIPLIDPLSKNIAAFRTYYNAFFGFLFAFFLYIFALMLAWNLGYQFNFSTAIVPALGVLFYVIGVLLPKAKRNWFFGIRTPWTLSNDIVWEKTHKLGGWLFRTLGVFLILGTFFLDGSVLFTVLIAGAVGSAVGTMVYSFVAYKRYV